MRVFLLEHSMIRFDDSINGALQDVSSSDSTAAMLRHYGWTPRVEVGLIPESDGGHLGRVTVVGPDGHDWLAA